jgi:DNA-binding transcriptional LysR family regulator
VARGALRRGLAAFHAAHPGVEVTLVEDTSDALLAGDPRVLMDLARAGLDVAIVPASAAEGLHVLEIRPRLRSRLELVWRVRRTREALADR